MSKSDDDPLGCVMLLDDEETVRRKFKRAVTDSGTEIRFDRARPAINNLLTIFQLLTKQSPEETEAHFAGSGYAQLKNDLADVMIEFLRPLQERVREISDEELNRVLSDGRERAEQIARATLDEAKARVGIIGARTPKP
jgi:tryptophanyl-tRNA synthetase